MDRFPHMMIPNFFPGLYVAFEGVDGAGKSSLLTGIKEWLLKMGGLSVTATKEPDKNSQSGKAIYKDLANPRGLHVTSPVMFQAIYAYDSKRNIRDWVLP